MTVSVIVPVHKTSPYFVECVNSALNQLHKDLEVLIVCNGELTVQLCEEYLKTDDVRVKYIKSERGRHHARNKGIEVSIGEYIQFLDYDDILFPTKIEAQLSELKSLPKNTISISQWKKFQQSIDENYIFPFKEIFIDRLINTQSLIEKLGEGGFIATASWLIPKGLLNNIYWIDSPNDDAVFLSEVLKNNPQIVMLPEILTGYRMHQENTSSQRSKEDLDKLLYSWTVIKRNLIDVETKTVYKYLHKSYNYLLQYSKEVKNYKMFYIYKKYFFYGMNSKVSIFTLLKKGLLIFK